MILQIDELDLQEMANYDALCDYEVSADSLLDEISSDAVLAHVLTTHIAEDVLLECNFDFDDSEKRLIIQNLLGHNHLATAEDMMDDFLKLFGK